MLSNRFIISISIILGYAYCQFNDLDVDDIKKKFEKNIPGFEAGLGELNTTNLPTQEDIEQLLKEKCEKNGGGEEAFNALKNQQAFIQECVEKYINATVIQAEIEKAKETGSMDEVLGKYCKKYPEIYQCFEKVTEQARACLDENEKSTMDRLLNLTSDLKEFLCFKDGDRIAMFIAEGGFECLDSKKDALSECANQTLSERMPSGELSLTNMPTFLFSDRDCSDLQKLRSCFISAMEECKDTTPANIMDAFFKFLRKHTPCNEKAIDTPVMQKVSGADIHTISGFILMVTLAVTKLF